MTIVVNNQPNQPVQRQVLGKKAKCQAVIAVMGISMALLRHEMKTGTPSEKLKKAQVIVSATVATASMIRRIN